MRTLYFLIITTNIAMLCLCFGAYQESNRTSNLEQELHTLRMKVGEIKDVHVCEDRTHETCQFDCDCNGGENCDTL